MTHFLISDVKPEGYKLEDILALVRNDILHRATKIMEDKRPEAQAVLDNNIKILGMLNQCIDLSLESTRILSKSFGDSVDGQPRIGKP